MQLSECTVPLNVSGDLAGKHVQVRAEIMANFDPASGAWAVALSQAAASNQAMSAPAGEE